MAKRKREVLLTDESPIVALVPPDGSVSVFPAPLPTKTLFDAFALSIVTYFNSPLEGAGVDAPNWVLITPSGNLTATQAIVTDNYVTTDFPDLPETPSGCSLTFAADPADLTSNITALPVIPFRIDDLTSGVI